jgi:hypothetical protein
MSILALTSDTLIGTAAAGNIEYNGQFFGTDSNASRAQLQRIVRGTALTTTSGTTADFTGIPAWVERITVMFQNVSLTTNDYYLVQLGTGSTTYTTTGYTSTASLVTTGNTIQTSTTGLIMYNALGAGFASGHMVITNITGNSWVATAVLKRGTDGVQMSAGDVTLGAALTAVRFTCNGGAFDSGTVNIIYEG